jgi:4-amino-4-deoxy-L-arabinose transferase-like glycosyltransferase
MVFKQPFGNPPDEYNRYLIPQYICNHGTLPNGFDEEIRIPGYGFSYAFQPVLPYMFQGYAMRLVSVFTNSETAFLYTARLVNTFLGLIMAYVVLLLGRKWFDDRRVSWFFSFLVTFLPQSIFVHTYVNTDSCCMLSIALILYGMTLCLEDDFSLSSSMLLSVGIILCALSYYNAYGYILSAILIFTAAFLKNSNNKIYFDHKGFVKKGLIIAVPVLLGIGWWFIRSAYLYDGDFLGLKTRNYCGSLYAITEYKPENINTFKNQGLSILDMLVKSDFINLSILSFIGIYGPMTIVSTIWLYRFYKVIFVGGILAEILFKKFPVKNADKSKTTFGNREKSDKYTAGFKFFVHANLIFCIVMPVILSIWYSYSTDYQPQGRYILPALIPICCYCAAGFDKISSIIENKISGSFKSEKFVQAGNTGILCKIKGKHITDCLYILTIAAMIILLFVTVYGYAFPYYAH